MLKCFRSRWNSLFQDLEMKDFLWLYAPSPPPFKSEKMKPFLMCILNVRSQVGKNYYEKIAGFHISATKMLVRSLKYTNLQPWAHSSTVIKPLLRVMVVSVRMAPTGSCVWMCSQQGVERFRRIRRYFLVRGHVSLGVAFEVSTAHARCTLFLSPSPLTSPLSFSLSPPLLPCLWVRM